MRLPTFHLHPLHDALSKRGKSYLRKRLCDSSNEFDNPLSSFSPLSLFKHASLSSIFASNGIQFNKIAEERVLPFFALSNIPRVENRESKGGPPSSLELSRSMRFPARSKSNQGTRLEGGANSLSTRESSIKFLLPVLRKLQRTNPSSSRARMNWKRLGTLLHVAFDVFMYHLSVSVRLAPF